MTKLNSPVTLLCVMRKTLACDQAEVYGALSKGFAFPLENLGSAVTKMDSYQSGSDDALEPTISDSYRLRSSSSSSENMVLKNLSQLLRKIL